jgi:parallel beta-helix repeat protein
MQLGLCHSSRGGTIRTASKGRALVNMILGRALAAGSAALLLWSGHAFGAACPEPPSTANAIDVRQFGARGDGQHDDTKAIQAAIRAAAPGATVHVPAGTYRVRVSGGPQDGLRLKSGITLVMDQAAVLQALPTTSGNSAVLRAWSTEDVRIFGGTLAGERHGHLGSSGEWGMGLDVRDSRRLLVAGTVARDAWGDGFYFGGKANSDIEVCGVVADGNRRNGMSIVAATNMTVRSSRFINTAGTPPEAGLDIEPNGGNATEDVVVFDSLFQRNNGSGIGVTSSCRNCAAINRNNTIRDNRIVGNRGDGIRLTYQRHTITGNTIEDSGRYGILMRRATSSIVRGNHLRGSRSSGLRLEGSQRNRIEANTLERNGRAIDLTARSRSNEVTRNRCLSRNAIIRRDRSSQGNSIAANDGCRQ